MFLTVFVPPNSHRRNSSLFCALHERLGWCATIAPEMNRARVAELVDALDLGSSAARRASSSLAFRTKELLCFQILFITSSPILLSYEFSRIFQKLDGIFFG